jgi:hypothetical protein
MRLKKLCIVQGAQIWSSAVGMCSSLYQNSNLDILVHESGPTRWNVQTLSVLNERFSEEIYSFMYSLFKDPLSNAGHILSKDGMMVGIEVERTCMKSVIDLDTTPAYIRPVLRKATMYLSKDDRWPGRF